MTRGLAMNNAAHIIVGVLTLSLGCADRLSAQVAQDSQYCAFEVSVRSPTGQPLSDVSVSAATRRSDSPFATVKTSSDGIARICDIPMRTRIDIHVGNGPCGAVTIRDLSPWWLTTQPVHVVYEPCVPRDYVYSFPSLCYLVIRIRNESDKPLPGVRLTLASTHQDDKGTLVSDQFGRIFQMIHHGETLRGSLENSGYASAQVTFECKPRSEVENEEVVTLRELERGRR
jgi:hypothetical protein